MSPLLMYSFDHSSSTKGCSGYRHMKLQEHASLNQHNCLCWDTTRKNLPSKRVSMTCKELSDISSKILTEAKDCNGVES